MSISQILKSGLAEAKSSGAKQVELRHLPAGGADELASETLAFLRSRPGRPSSVSGWTALSPAKAGVIAWWAGEAGLTSEAQRRSIRDLQRQIYGLLDERGLIVKPAGPSAVVDVSPAPVTETQAAGAATAEPATAAKAAKAKPAKAAKAAKAKPAKAKPAKAAKAVESAGEPAKAAEPAAASGGAEAWVLRLDPSVWDLARFIADGHHEVSAWAVEDNERSAAMAHGQRVFLWAGGDGTLIAPGVWGVGWVVGPCQSKSIADGYWVDPADNSQRGLFADVSIQLMPQPVGLNEVANDPRLAAIEILQDPFVSNPSRVTADESAALVALLGLDPALPVQG